MIFADVLKHLVLPYTGPTLKLYRGELRSRHVQKTYGLSWTPHLEVARMFADRRSSGEGPGIVLEIDATPGMIITPAEGHSSYIGEDEILLDPLAIQEAVRETS